MIATVLFLVAFLAPSALAFAIAYAATGSAWIAFAFGVAAIGLLLLLMKDWE